MLFGRHKVNQADVTEDDRHFVKLAGSRNAEGPQALSCSA